MWFTHIIEITSNVAFDVIARWIEKNRSDFSKSTIRVENLNGSGDFANLPFQQQIIGALRDLGEAISKNDLLKELHNRGSKIPNGTLLSYLSRGKRDKVFERVDPGLWKLK